MSDAAPEQAHGQAGPAVPAVPVEAPTSTEQAAQRQQLGEVIRASHSAFTVETYELHSTPPLGALVVAQDVLGVVCSAQTESLTPISALGSPEDEDGGVYTIYPDLQRILRSQFDALVVGCYLRFDGLVRGPVYAYPECPPRVHYKCWLASNAELVEFTSRPDYLRLLLCSAESANVDQVIIHLVLKAFRARDRDRDWLFSTAEYLGRQLKGDYDRLLALLKTLDALTQSAPQSQPGIADSIGTVKY
jgi:hypothetical protein